MCVLYEYAGTHDVCMRLVSRIPPTKGIAVLGAKDRGLGGQAQ